GQVQPDLELALVMNVDSPGRDVRPADLTARLTAALDADWRRIHLAEAQTPGVHYPRRNSALASPPRHGDDREGAEADDADDEAHRVPARDPTRARGSRALQPRALRAQGAARDHRPRSSQPRRGRLTTEPKSK